MGDWTFYVNYLENLKKVTTSDIQEVVKKYFVEEHRTIGQGIPKTEGGDKAEMKPSSWYEAQTKAFYKGNDSSEGNLLTAMIEPAPAQTSNISDNIKSNNIGGVKVVTAKTGVKDVITFRGSLAAGDSFSPESNSIIADLTGNMLDKGTEKNDKFALAEKLENLGAELSFSVNTHSLNFRGKCLSKDIDEVVGLLAEQLRSPAFDQEEFEKLKVQREGSFKRSLEETSVRASEKADSMLFPLGHPKEFSRSSKVRDVTTAGLGERTKTRVTTLLPPAPL